MPRSGVLARSRARAAPRALAGLRARLCATNGRCRSTLLSSLFSLSLSLFLLLVLAVATPATAATATTSSSSAIIAEGAKRLEVDAARVVSNVS